MLSIHIIHLEDSTKINPLLHQLKKRHVIKQSAIDTRSAENTEKFRHLIDVRAWSKLNTNHSLGFRTEHRDLTRGSVGCYLSHIEVWRKITDGISMIMEEDARFVDYEKFTSIKIPPVTTWDIILFGCIDLRPGRVYNENFKYVTHFLETHAYLIRSASIMKMLPYMFPITQQLDWQLSFLAQNKKIKILAVTPSLIRQDKSSGTTIQVLPVKREKL